MLGPILDLLFPQICLICNSGLLPEEKHLCLHCRLSLPETQYHSLPENQLERSLWGRFSFHRAFSFLYFNTSGATQKMLHSLKYDGNEELAVFLGKIYGKNIRQTVENHKIDSIVAVPLHRSRLLKRGYNQSKAFAEGLCQTLGFEDLSDCVIRTRSTKTQTKMNRMERWQNVDEIFEVREPSRFNNKHVLIADDVITTGATLESLARVLQRDGNCKISVVSIAHAA